MGSAPQGEAIRLLGLEFANRPLPQVAASLAARPADAPFAYVVTANSHQLVRLSQEADLRPLYEGAWMRLLGSRVVFKLCRMLALPAPAVISGCDLIPNPID
jgi:UDP-N-acetyl-D-mannosaminuronic acid transferase (WecB/TagA/CpsF family)